MANKDLLEMGARLEAQGPPKEPTIEAPGLLLGIFNKMMEEARKVATAPISAEAMVAMLAHVIDLQSYALAVQAYEHNIRLYHSLRDSRSEFQKVEDIANGVSR
jgi:hypothetical protein